MLGAIVGDIVGSVHEWACTKSKDFPLFTSRSTFTDDTVLTVAVADWILSGDDLVDVFHRYYDAYPDRGFGGMFHRWALARERAPYNSFGNGSAMRVSPVGFALNTMGEVLEWSETSAAVTHSHPEGIRGAQATAVAIHAARSGKTKAEIKALIERDFGYDLGERLDQIRSWYSFDETCEGTVPQALIAFFESADFEDAIRNAVSLGGDADTLACITGGIAEAYYGSVPEDLAAEAIARLDPGLRDVVQRFQSKFGLRPAPTPPTRP